MKSRLHGGLVFSKYKTVQIYMGLLIWWQKWWLKDIQMKGVGILSESIYKSLKFVVVTIKP